jgi:hypothetical protein
MSSAALIFMGEFFPTQLPDLLLQLNHPQFSTNKKPDSSLQFGVFIL